MGRHILGPENQMLADQLANGVSVIGKMVPLTLSGRGIEIEGIAWRNPSSTKVVKFAVKRGSQYLLFRRDTKHRFMGGDPFRPNDELKAAFNSQ